MTRRYCWIPEWGECALASASDVYFSSLLGEVAAYDAGACTVCFWKFGPDVKMKCCARMVLREKFHNFRACFAGYWFVYCEAGYVGPVMMIRRHPKRRHAVLMTSAPLMPLFKPSVYDAEVLIGVNSLGLDLFAVLSGPNFFFERKVVSVYRQNQDMQWVLLYTACANVAEAQCVIKPHFVLAVGFFRSKHYVFTEAGPHALDSDACVVVLNRTFDVLWSCRVEDFGPYSSGYSWIWATDALVVGRNAVSKPFTLCCCPGEQRQCLRKVNKARQCWISACA